MRSVLVGMFGSCASCTAAITSLQAKCGALQLDDKSRYTIPLPRVWGLIPRLASQIRIEQINAILEQTAGQGFAVSVELLDCETVGFQGEPGNFICRSGFCATLEIAASNELFSSGLMRTSGHSVCQSRKHNQSAETTAGQ